jgi:hypothetical protein
MKAFWQVLVLLAVAAALTVLLTHIETRGLPASFDICENDGAVERPILTFDYIQSMCMCTKPGKRGMAYTELTGVYERTGVPRFVAVAGGVIIPLILLLAAAVTAGRALRGSARIIVGIILLGAGGLSFLAASFELFQVLGDSYRYRWMVQFWLFDPYTPRDVLVWVLAALLLAGSIWLFGSAWHDWKAKTAGRDRPPNA